MPARKLRPKAAWGHPAHATIAAVSMTWEAGRQVPNLDRYFHRHSQGNNVKSFVLVSERTQIGTPATERRDEKGHLNVRDGNVVLASRRTEL